ncbi:unnamed protein product, partial [Amoebophrya sp. A25]
QRIAPSPVHSYSVALVLEFEDNSNAERVLVANTHLTWGSENHQLVRLWQAERLLHYAVERRNAVSVPAKPRGLVQQHQSASSKPGGLPAGRSRLGRASSILSSGSSSSSSAASATSTPATPSLKNDHPAVIIAGDLNEGPESP